MKTLFLNTWYTPNLEGGAERVIQSLAEGSVNAGHRAVVISVGPKKGTWTDRINGVKVYYVGLKNLYWPYENKGKPNVLKPLWHALDTYNPWMAREVARILDVEQPDVVNTSTLAGFSASVFRPVKQRGLPLIHLLQEYYLLCPRVTMFRNGENCERQCLRCRLYGLPRKHLSDQVDTVVGASRFTLERHLRFGYFAATPKKRVIYNIHQIDTAPSLNTHSLPIRFGFLGRLDPTKGLEVLLDSAIHLPSTTTWSLDIGGRGLAKYERYLRAKYRMPTIKFSGYVEPEGFFEQIDVLVVPSLWHDPSPRVINEAYARGVPVIGSSRGGIPELVADGYTGFIFNPDYPGDLMAKMQRFVSEPRLIDSMGTACLAKAESFRPSNIIEQYLQVYTEVVKDV